LIFSEGELKDILFLGLIFILSKAYNSRIPTRAAFFDPFDAEETGKLDLAKQWGIHPILESFFGDSELHQASG
jgi:hypothetical protein